MNILLLGLFIYIHYQELEEVGMGLIMWHSWDLTQKGRVDAQQRGFSSENLYIFLSFRFSLL